MEKLFDEGERDYLGPAAYGESGFVYLNRSARPECQRIRNLLEEWFRDFPSQNRMNLGERFRSKNDREYFSAFFELYLFELFLKCGFTVEVHPEIEGKRTRPDFKVFKGGKALLYLEATLAKVTQEKISTQKLKNKIFAKINENIHSPNFFLGCEIQMVSTQEPPIKKICQFLEEKISKLDPDLIADQLEKNEFEGLPEWEWKCRGWRITFFPIPKKAEARGKPGRRTIGFINSGWHLVTPQSGIKKSIKDKSSKYGELDLPYIIAINVVDELPVDNIDISNALFGEEQVIVTFQGNKAIGEETRRKRNGAWFGPQGSRNTRISGALITVNLSPWNITKVTPVLWHNPWANKPLSPELLPFPKFLAGEGNSLKELKGKNGWELFGLDPNWPEENRNNFHFL